MITLRPHQKTAYESWMSANFNGIVKSPTGTGKSIIALKAIENNSESIVILVRTVNLAEQWIAHINRMGLECGLVGNGKEEWKSITVCIGASVRDVKIKCRLLIVDEIHGFFADITYQTLLNAEYQFFLGLSATPERELKTYDEFIKLHPIVSDYSLEDAIEDKTVCEFEIKLIPCPLTEFEQKQYDEVSARVAAAMKEFNGNFPLMIRLCKVNQSAAQGMRAIQERKKMLSQGLGKSNKTIEILTENKDKKVIVFSEHIDTLDYIQLEMDKVHPGRCMQYHSKIKKKEKANLIENFNIIPNAVILCSKAMDEGIDLPDCDTAIVISGTSSSRQFIQRLGRIIRPKEGKIATLHNLYIPDTKDSDWVKKRGRGYRKLR